MTESDEFPYTSAAAFTFWEVPKVFRSCPWSELQPLYDFQGGRCAMCGYGDVDLVVDHDHQTGMIRGLLCRSCNASEPHNDHEAWQLWRAGTTPMALLGLEEEYSAPFYHGPPKQTVTDQRLSDAVRGMGLE